MRETDSPYDRHMMAVRICPVCGIDEERQAHRKPDDGARLPATGPTHAAALVLRIGQLEKQRRSLRKALRALVACKDYKDISTHEMRKAFEILHETRRVR